MGIRGDAWRFSDSECGRGQKAEVLGLDAKGTLSVEVEVHGGT